MVGAAAGNDDDIALDLALVTQQVRVQERTEARVIVAVVPVGGQGIFHSHVLAPDLPNSALGVSHLAQALAAGGQLLAQVVVRGIDARLGSAVHLLVLSTGQLVESNIELVKIAAVGSGVKGHFTGEGQLLGDHSLDLGIGVDHRGLRLSGLCVAQAEAGKRGQNRHRAEHHHSARQGQKAFFDSHEYKCSFHFQQVELP